MGVINKPYTYSANTTISSSKVNANEDTIYNEFNGSISAANLASDAVTTAKIADANVTTAKIANSNVTTAKINDGAVTSEKLTTTVAFKVYDASGTSFTNGVDSIKATWATELYDYGNNFASNKFTAPYNGIYHFTACLGDFTSATTRSFISLYKNGSLIAGSTDGANRKVALAVDLKLAATDYIEVYCFQSSGANRTGSSSENTSFFTGYLIGKY